MFRTVILFVVLASGMTVATDSRKVFLGYFEAGRNPVHAALRDEFERQIELVAPEGVQFVFIPQGYRSAEWKRDSCRTLARELIRVDRVDVMVTMGPWVVEDLLAAGYKKPILAMYRFEPFSEGLVDASGNPTWPNLTVHGKTNKLEDDLAILTALFHPTRIGFLFFPSNTEHDSVVARLSFAARRLKTELVSAVGTDNNGAFAFFKALDQLPKDVDAIYVGPLWGLDEQKASSFFERMTNSGVPVLSYDANPSIQLGALASNAGYTHIAEARFNARKLVQLTTHERPSDLPTGFGPTAGLTINMKALGKVRKPIPPSALREAMTYDTYIPDNAATYDITGAISRVLAHNPRAYAAAERETALQEKFGIAKTSWYPKLSLEGGAAWRDDNAVNNLERSLRNDGYRGSLAAEQTLFSRLQMSNRHLAKHESALGALHSRAERRFLCKSMESAYLAVLETAEKARNAKQHRLVIDRLRELSWPRERFESKPSWERARLELEHYDATIAINQAAADVESARASFNALCNLPADAPFALDSAAFNSRTIYSHYTALSQFIETTEAERKMTAYFQQSAADNNHSLSAARMHVTGAQIKSSAAASSRYPEVSLRGSLDFTDELTSNGNVVEQSPSATIAATVKLPLFGGPTGKAVALRQAELNEAEFERDAVSLDVMNNIASLSADFFATLANVPIALQHEQQASRHLVEITKEYEAGRIPLADFLGAAEASRRAHERLTELQFRYFRVVSDLVHVIGWTGTDDIPFDRLFISKIRDHFAPQPTK